jgi:hypothetical protein
VQKNSIKLYITYYATADGESKENTENLSRKAHGNWPLRKRTILRGIIRKLWEWQGDGSGSRPYPMAGFNISTAEHPSINISSAVHPSFGTCELLTPKHEPHCSLWNIMLWSGLQVHYSLSFQTLSADSLAKFICTSGRWHTGRCEAQSHELVKWVKVLSVL